MKTVKNYNELTEMEKVTFDSLVAKSMKTFSYNRTTKYDFLMVMTPKPYVILKEHYSPDLDKCVEFLYSLMKMLKISKRTAVERDYTLNIKTGERLRDIAWNKNNREASHLIANHNW